MWIVSLLFLYLGFSTIGSTINDPKFGQPGSEWWSVSEIILSVALIVVGLVGGYLEWRGSRKVDVKTVYVDRPVSAAQDDDDKDDNDDWEEFILLTRQIPFVVPKSNDFLTAFRLASDEAIAACVKEFSTDSVYEYPVVSIKVYPIGSSGTWAMLEVQYYVHPDDFGED